jgi:hypothetical protein
MKNCAGRITVVEYGDKKSLFLMMPEAYRGPNNSWILLDFCYIGFGPLESSQQTIFTFSYVYKHTMNFVI